MNLTATFVLLLEPFRPVFTTPSFLIFTDVITGWALSPRHRFVTELIFSSGSLENGHFSRYHYFFAYGVWVLDRVFEVLALILVCTLAPRGTVLLAVDDTLCLKRGLTLYGAGMHHDPLISSRRKKLTRWGHDWVVICLLLVHPFWAPTKVFALPIGVRLYKNRQGLTKGRRGKKRPRKKKRNDPSHRTRPELAVELIRLVAGWFPARRLLLTGDSLYGGKSVLGKLPANVDAISHVHPQGALYASAPPKRAGQRGPQRKKGERLPGLVDWANDATQPWHTLVFDQFGLHATLLVKTRQALYYTAGKDRLLTIVLVRDATGQRLDQMFYCTCLAWDARTVLSHYAFRWAIECTFKDSKQLLGLQDPANRLPKAVQRTAPIAWVLYSLTVLWFHCEGHSHVVFPVRPWYRKKREPSFADMLTTLRRLSWQEKLLGVRSSSGPHEKVIGQMIEFVSRAG